MERKNKLKIALVGNPNVGKSTLFNALTGAKQHIGNWPGKTVEKKSGNFSFQGKEIELIDLPGSYSLSAFTEEEIITSEYIMQKKADFVIQIIDAQNLARNLFMTIQLLETSVPLVIALNMVDLASDKGEIFNIKKLSELLGIPVIIIDAKKNKNINFLLKRVLTIQEYKNVFNFKITYGLEINKELDKLAKFLLKKDDYSFLEAKILSLKALEKKLIFENDFSQKIYFSEFIILVKKSRRHLENIFSKDIETILASARYGFINGLIKEVIQVKKTKFKINFTDYFDKIAINKFLGIPLFLLIIWFLFQATFKLSIPIINQIELLFSFLNKFISVSLYNLHASKWLISLVNEGIISGVGGILVFVPIIAILFFLMAFLEDSGYMSRVAFIMDKMMHKIGLHGKAFIPLILGFGCNVPGIMATRTLETKKDRLLTILINPFMSCSGRLPIYALFAGAFFSKHQSLVIFSLYILGIIVAIIVGLFFKKFLFKNLSSPFVIELPPYRWPTLKGLIIHTWEKVWLFIKKAGTLILAFSVIIWFLASFPIGVKYGSENSLAANIGKSISPVFKPLGFDNWQSSVALIFGFTAKEVVVGSFSTLYGADHLQSLKDPMSLNTALHQDFTPLSAYSFMVFVLLYIPCIAVVAVVKKETDSWKWPLFMILYSLIIAWLIAFIIYQGGKIFGFN